MRRVGLALLVVLATACGAIGENLAEEMIEQSAEAGGGDVNIDIDDEGQVSMSGSGPEGEQFDMTMGGGEIPDDFPIPVMDGGTVIAVNSMSSGDESSTGVSIEYPADAFDQLVDFYQDYVDGLGNEDIQRSESSTAEFKSVSWFSNDGQFNIGVNSWADQEMTSVNLNSGF